jgi:hypothetical protein
MHPVAQGLAIHAAGLAMPQVLPCRRSCHAAGLAMPQVLAALVRSAPSRTIASANIRRDAALSFSRPAATRSSMAVKSLWVTAIAAIVLAPLHTKSPSIQTFSDSGILTSHPFSPLVLDGVIGRSAFRSLEILGAALQADGGTRSAFAASSIRRRSVSHGPFCRTRRISQGDKYLRRG